MTVQTLFIPTWPNQLIEFSNDRGLVYQNTQTTVTGDNELVAHALLYAGAICNNATKEKGQPTEVALMNALHNAGLSVSPTNLLLVVSGH